MEPKQKKRKLERYRRRIGMLQAFSNVSNKIWVFVDDDHGIDIIYDLEQQLTLKFTNLDTQVSFIVTFVYAKCDSIERIELWDSLYNLARDMTLPWHCITTCNLSDLGFQGSIYSWWNGRGGKDCIFKRLDRCLGNPEFQQLCPNTVITHLSKIGYDHSPMLITCNADELPIKKAFKFLNFWTKHDSFIDVVRENWKTDFMGDPFFMFNQKLKRLKKALTAWSRATYGDIFKKIASLEEVVLAHEAEFEKNPTFQNRVRLQKVQAELIRYLALEEEFWKQKAGMNWFQDGDRNTKFFHAQVNGRRKRLQLRRVQNNAGIWLENTADMADEANAELVKLPTREEIKYVVFGLNGESAGGPDGFSRFFFQTCWEIIGDDVVNMVKAFFCGHELPRVIHERLVGMLPNLISEEQAGFVKGRSIVENIMLTQEIITDIRLRTKAGPNVVIKLDMTKAYDRLSWLFLTKVLRKMGFGERSTRGVKQGDPLSPTLFILAAEAMSRGLNALHRNKQFCGFGMPKWSPKINHLAYADDTIIFSSSDNTSLKLIMDVLAAYEIASGQLINKIKSVVYLHHSASNEVVDKNWKGKLLSIGGRAVLISHILQSMPIHLLSAVNPPAYVINKLHKIFAQFFWCSSVGVANRHWASWGTLCLPCEEGGVGFRSLHDMATALCCKLWWNFRTKPTLWSAFMSQKYSKKINPMVVPWSDGSHVWRKMLECRDIIEHKILWQPRMGSALFWYENWTGLGSLYFVTPPDFVCDETVHNIYDVVQNGQWDEERIKEILPEDIAAHILDNIQPPVECEKIDNHVWMLETRGEFSVKSAWDYLRRRQNPSNAYRNIWVKGLPFKIAFFMWKVWRNKLPLDDFFRKLGYLMASKCWCCTEPKEETMQHLFFTSYAANKVWRYYLGHAGISMEGITLHQAIIKCWTAEVIPRLKPIMQALPSVILWELWKRRNSYKYGYSVTINRVVYQISTTMQSLIKLRKPAMQNVPNRWPDMLKMMEQYTPILKYSKVLWELPQQGWIKVNTDGASRGNPGRSSIGFALRNEEGDLVYACGKEVNEGSNTSAEAMAIYEALKFCIDNDYVLIELHTDSMMLKNVITGTWAMLLFYGVLEIYLVVLMLSIHSNGLKLHLDNSTVTKNLKRQGIQQQQ
ncbi:PREDICTED: uncharacterized protein LOC109231725 [Nicotiana attenuata]|uniref:uncharacterized protein LOC109231725 n=1 Tax=Nicotiana attenuata TaxID=49451 RepID=UPI000904F6AD|nr:PREDICTED: uncharacterized protein LOC109231725 [Nicotiana attenuata]